MDTNTTPKVCENCGKAFKSVRLDARTCSVRCRVALHRSAVDPHDDSGRTALTALHAVLTALDARAHVSLAELRRAVAAALQGAPTAPAPKPEPKVAPKVNKTSVTSLRNTSKAPVKHQPPPEPEPDYEAIAAAHGAQLALAAQGSDTDAMVSMVFKMWKAKTHEQRIAWARKNAPPTMRERQEKAQRNAERKAKIKTNRITRHARRAQLHPDKMGREQTPAERAEYTRLTKRRRKHK
jgi:hypothetical protein